MRNAEIIKGNIFCSSLNYEITHTAKLKYEVYSFIDIVSNYYNLQPVLIERINYIFNELWNKHTTFFNAIRYENTVLGVVLFVDREFYDESVTPIDVSWYVQMLYGKENIDKNIVQVYSVYQNVNEIFNLVSIQN